MVVGGGEAARAALQDHPVEEAAGQGRHLQMTVEWEAVEWDTARYQVVGGGETAGRLPVHRHLNPPSLHLARAVQC